MKGRLILLAVASVWAGLASHSPAQEGLLLDPKRTWAIVVGIDNYLYIDDLKYSVADARLMYTVLTDPLGIGLSPDRVFLHLSALNVATDTPSSSRGIDVQVEPQERSPEYPRLPAPMANYATTESIENSLTYILKNAKDDDVLVFYFAGHGDNYEDDLYLCTLETTITRGQPLAPALSMKKILERIRQSRLKTTLFIIDSCRSGTGAVNIEQLRLSQLPQFRRILQGKPAGSPTGRGIDVQAEKSPSVAVPRILALFSARDNQLAYEIDELGHGAFTYYLTRALRGGALGASEFRRQVRTPGRIIFTDLERYLQNTVSELVFTYTGQEQRPTFFPDLQAIGRIEATKFHPLFGISVVVDTSVAPSARVEVSAVNPAQKIVKETPCVFSVQELDRTIREVDAYTLRIYPKSLPPLTIDTPLVLNAPLSIRVSRENGVIKVHAQLGARELTVVNSAENSFIISY